MTHDTGHSRDGTTQSTTHASHADLHASSGERLRHDSSPAAILAAAAEVLLPRRRTDPGIHWPFGRRARERRARRRARREAITRQRHAFISAASAVLAGHTGPMAPTHDDHTRHNRDYTGSAPDVGDSGLLPDVPVPEPVRDGSPPLSPARAPDRRSQLRVITLLAVVVVAVAVAALWFSRGDSETDTASKAGTDQPLQTSHRDPGGSVTPGSSTPSGDGEELSPIPPIPSGGVTPVVPPAADVTDPDDVKIVDPPHGNPSATELSTPEGAVRAWLARWCPFRYTDQFAAAEQRAKAAMTDAGWTTFNPVSNDAVPDSWAQTVAARESGLCGAPTAAVSPEAPRSDTSAIVIASIDRVITAPGQAPYVEHISEVRVVQRGTDGLWRVDLPTNGG